MTDFVKKFLRILQGEQKKRRVTITISDKGVVSVDPASLLHATVSKKQLDAAKRVEQLRRVVNE